MTSQTAHAIIIVDDEPIALFILSKMLQKLCPDWKVETLNNPASAQVIIQNPDGPRPSVMFMDLNMPGHSGWSLLEAMKESGYSGDVVVLTSSVASDDRKKAMEFPNVKGYLIKPVTLDELKEQLGKIEGFTT